MLCQPHEEKKKEKRKRSFTVGLENLLLPLARTGKLSHAAKCRSRPSDRMSRGTRSLFCFLKSFEEASALTMSSLRRV